MALPSRTTAWYTVALLFLAYLLSFVDRQIIALMVDPIKHDLGLSDFQFSLLHGLGFGLFYAVFGIPIALAADRYSRTRIIGWGIVAWSIMTALCGTAHSYAQLFAWRIGVGIGEAALAPAAYSLLSDSFDRRSLPRAVAVFSMGSTVGSGLALIAGGELLAVMSRIDRTQWSWLAGFSDWQLAFFLVGLPGVLLAVFLLRLAEPARRGVERGVQSTVREQLRYTLGWLGGHRRLYLGLFAAIAAMTALSSGFIVWFPAYLMRVHHLPVGETGLWFGAAFAICASLGVLAGGWLVAWLYRFFGHQAYIWVMMGAVTAAAGAYAAVALASTVAQALGLVSVAIFFTQSLAGVSVTAIQLITPNELRAQMSSIFLLFVNLLGYGLGAPVIAALTDMVWHDPQALGLALGTTAVLIWPVAIGALVLACGAYRRAALYV